MQSVLITAGSRRVSFCANLTNRARLRCFSVYSWGSGDEGQLGHSSIIKKGLSSTYVESKPKQIDFFSGINNKLIIQDISAGRTHSAALTSDGQLYTWGDCEYGKLGHEIVTDTLSGKKLCLLPTRVNVDYEKLKFKQVVCGAFHTAALSQEGDVYTWGWNGSTWSGIGCLGYDLESGIQFQATPRKVEFPAGLKMTQISSGKYHMAALGEEGEVWTWGNGEFGKIGDGGSKDAKHPVPVEYFLDINVYIKQLSCGSNFTLALDRDGQVHGWGGNDSNQLGLGGGFAVDMFAMEEYPRMLDSLEGEEIIKVSSGKTHAIAVSRAGEVYLWGMKMWMEPHKMTVLKDQQIIDASCGSNVSVVVNDVGQLFSWGKGLLLSSTGVLGREGGTSQPELIPDSTATGFRKVSCGSKHVLGLTGVPELPK